MQVRSIVERLLEVLTTPSETVQRAVSGCLPPLMGGLAADAEYVAALVQRLLGMLSADRYGDRCAALAARSEPESLVLHAVGVVVSKLHETIST
jgi:hypothetical protein